MIRNIFITLLLTVLFFSCNTDTTAPQEQNSINDAALIQAIASAPEKQSINLEQLPSISQYVLDKNYSESYIDDAKIAPQFGYEVNTRREWGTHIGERWPVYFDLNGRELREERGSVDGQDFERHSHDRGECFMLVYPVTFIMPDGSTITGEDGRAICTAIKDWYEANPDSKERPVLQFPVEVTLRDGTTITINNADELRALKEDCDNWDGDHHGDHDWDDDDHGDHVPCFTLVYPVTYIMPDGSEITVADRTDWAAIKSWYEANPDSIERPVLLYPVDVTLSDGNTITVNNADEMHNLKEECDDWDDDGDHHGDHDGDGD